MKWWRSFRFAVVLLSTFALFSISLLKSSMSFAMVCMVNHTFAASHSNLVSTRNVTNFFDANNSTIASKASLEPMYAECNIDVASQNKTQSTGYKGKLEWSSAQQGQIFSGYFWGSAVGAVTSGWLADRYGTKLIIMFAILANAAGAALIPTLSAFGYEFVMVARLWMGFFQGVLAPSMYVTLGRWVLPNERSTALALYSSGTEIASVIGLPLYGLLCQAEFLDGWPAIFYVASSTVIPVLIAWAFLASNSAETSKMISKKEQEYVAQHLQNQHLASGKVTAPYRKMASSLPLLVCCFCVFTNAFSADILHNYLPTYFKQVHHLNVKQNGIFSAVPYLVHMILRLLVSFGADKLSQRTTLGRTRVCKIFTGIAFLGIAGSLTALSFVDCRWPVLAVALLSCAEAFGSLLVPGLYTVILFMAPSFTGSIKSATTVFSNLAGVTGPYVVGWLTPQGRREEWQTVFFSCAALMIFAAGLFQIFGTAEIQTWAKVFPAPVDEKQKEHSRPEAPAFINNKEPAKQC